MIPRRLRGRPVGPLPCGAAFDLFGSYTRALLIFAAQPVLCAAAILLAPLPRLRDAETAEPAVQAR